ncbi:hypothetical protein [Agromyces sp. Leaf222]|uniref:hypothetical protein n=1 Tax=Agromyces sp. Leaf222 TaxID=1735688 RepID=UPI000A9A4E9B|nr:hypothetical protein [Agromyces sp. Leaf222]
MLRTRLRIDGRDYLLPSDDDPETVMANVTALVRAGGGFVETVRTMDRTVSVFVSAGMSLSVEVTEIDGDSLEAEEEGAWLVQSAFEAYDLE